MLEFEEKDIEILNYILRNSKSTYGVTAKHLIDEGKLKGGLYADVAIENKKEKEEFERLMGIIESYSCAEIKIKTIFLGDESRVIAIPKTYQFLNNGGFRSVYDSFLRKKLKEEKELKSLKWETKLYKFQVKYKWLPFIISTISIIIAIISLIISFIGLNK